MNTAWFVKSLKEGWRGDARLYRLTPPIERTVGEEVTRYEFVIVSATDVLFSGEETYIFPATAEGEVVSWGELDGSFRGSCDHVAALGNAGYELVVGGSMTDEEFLLWVHSKLVNVYGENCRYDYMKKLHALALAQPKGKITTWSYREDPRNVSTEPE